MELLENAPCLAAAADPPSVVGEPVLFEGTVLRLVKDTFGGWVETWDGSRWVKPTAAFGPASKWALGRHMSNEELRQRGLCNPLDPKPRAA
jgi:hypothetical protein